MEGAERCGRDGWPSTAALVLEFNPAAAAPAVAAPAVAALDAEAGLGSEGGGLWGHDHWRRRGKVQLVVVVQILQIPAQIVCDVSGWQCY